MLVSVRKFKIYQTKKKKKGGKTSNRHLKDTCCKISSQGKGLSLPGSAVIPSTVNEAKRKIFGEVELLGSRERCVTCELTCGVLNLLLSSLESFFFSFN